MHLLLRRDFAIITMWIGQQDATETYQTLPLYITVAQLSRTIEAYVKPMDGVRNLWFGPSQ